MVEAGAAKPTFVVVRPYPAGIRRRVFGFLEDQGYTNAHTVEVGTPDALCAETVRDLSMDLLLLPYHKHKASDGGWVNGLGVLAALGDGWAGRGIPILMPVDEFTWAASFEREHAELACAAPDLASRLVVMRESEIGEEHVIEALRTAAA